MSHTFGFAPRTRPESKFFPVHRFAVVPRERVYGRVPPDPKPTPVDLAARREREIHEAYRAGFRAAEAKYGAINSARQSMRDICVAVARKHGLTFADLRSDRRLHAIVLARHEAMWRCFHETKSSYPSIGRVLNKDHTTIMHGVQKHEERLRLASSG